MKYLNKGNMQKLISMHNRYTTRELYYKIREKMQAPYRDYNQQVHQYLPTGAELENQRKDQAELKERPLISIVVPTYETDPLFLTQMIDSVRDQTYDNWQLCIADGSRTDQVEEMVRRFIGSDHRIRYQCLAHNGGISENTNQGFAMADGDYIALLDHDDLLVPSALYEMVKAVSETHADVLYSDEDKVSGDLSCYMDPHFKLDFNQELLLGNNYICHFLMFSREVLEKAGGLDSRYDGAQDFDFVLRLSECARRIHHIPKILYHWRIHSGSTAGNTDSKLYAYEAGKRAVEAYLKRNGLSGTVAMDGELGFYKVKYDVPKGITVGIQTWGETSQQYKNIRQQIEKELEQLGAEIFWNGETDCKCNDAADYILTVNRAVTNIKEGSVALLLGSCARPGIRAVGSKTIAKGRVVQCGFWEKKSGKTARFAGLPCHFKGYFRRAYLSVEADALSNDLTVTAANRTDGKIIVEPASEVTIRA